MVSPSRIEGLVVHVVEWYASVKGSFADAEALQWTAAHHQRLHCDSKSSGKGPCFTPLDLHYRRCDSELPTDTRCLSETLAAQPSRHRVMGYHGYRGLTPHGSVAAGKEVLGLLPGPGAQDPVPPRGMALYQQRPGQVQVTGRVRELILQWKEASSFFGLLVEHQVCLSRMTNFSRQSNWASQQQG
ncbi:hypothetical protein E2C01_081432 [Portunus trituberculatus]|uniref:Uncharacterized protein n=1 Tax=Portunus trituberculatus TaxID=210409 RepID=A0A5B7J149_PORTR|nr:hypothetical protein [Portunus trituberculatus]